MEAAVEDGRQSGSKGEGEASMRMSKDLWMLLKAIRERDLAGEGEASKKESDEENMTWSINCVKQELQASGPLGDATKMKRLEEEVSRILFALEKKKRELGELELEEKMVGLGKMVCESDAAPKRGAKGKGKAKREADAAPKRGAKGKAKAKAKREAEAEKMKQKVEEWRRKEAEKASACDPEKINDPYAFQAWSFEQRWTQIYGRMGYGNFNDNSE